MNFPKSIMLTVILIVMGPFTSVVANTGKYKCVSGDEGQVIKKGQDKEITVTLEETVLWIDNGIGVKNRLDSINDIDLDGRLIFETSVIVDNEQTKDLSAYLGMGIIMEEKTGDLILFRKNGDGISKYYNCKL